MSGAGERLKKAIHLAGFKSIAEFAAAIGMEPVTVRQQINRDSIPIEAAEIYARKLRRIGATTDWLLFRKGPAPGSGASKASRPGPAEPDVEYGAHPTVPVRFLVGAGGEVQSLADDDIIDWEPAPPGMEDAEVTEVRGHSMMPAYRHGDRLFHRREAIPIVELLGEIVVARTRDGKRWVKQLTRGSSRGYYTLVSINPAFPPLENVVLDWAVAIAWVKKRARSLS